MTDAMRQKNSEITEHELNIAAAAEVSALKPRDPKPATSITAAPPLAQWNLIEQARQQLRRRLDADRARLREEWRSGEAAIRAEFDAAVLEATRARDLALDSLQQSVNARIVELDHVARRMGE